MAKRPLVGLVPGLGRNESSPASCLLGVAAAVAAVALLNSALHCVNSVKKARIILFCSSTLCLSETPSTRHESSSLLMLSNDELLVMFEWRIDDDDNEHSRLTTVAATVGDDLADREEEEEHAAVG